MILWILYIFVYLKAYKNNKDTAQEFLSCPFPYFRLQDNCSLQYPFPCNLLFSSSMCIHEHTLSLLLSPSLWHLFYPLKTGFCRQSLLKQLVTEKKLHVTGKNTTAQVLILGHLSQLQCSYPQHCPEPTYPFPHSLQSTFTSPVPAPELPGSALKHHRVMLKYFLTTLKTAVIAPAEAHTAMEKEKQTKKLVSLVFYNQSDTLQISC